MNTALPAGSGLSLVTDLRAFLALCDEALALATRESQALAGQVEYRPFDFFQQRKKLIPDLETCLIRLRHHRNNPLHSIQKECGFDQSQEVKSMFQTIQAVLMKVLCLDRENQQALLRRGLVPANHLPPAAAQRPSFIAGLYQRHAQT